MQTYRQACAKTDPGLITIELHGPSDVTFVIDSPSTGLEKQYLPI